MSQQDEVISFLTYRGEPSNAAQIFDHVFNTGGKIVTGTSERKKLIAALSKVLNMLCEQERLVRVSVKPRGHYYCLPQWYTGNRLKKKYQHKLDNKPPLGISVALVDDQVLFRKALKNLLLSWKNINVTIEADNGPMFIEKMRASTVIPDICILSSVAVMLDDNSLLKEIKNNFKNMKVLVIAPYDHDFSFCKMIHDGANGYLAKTCRPEELEEAIFTLRKQKHYFERDPVGAWELLNEYNTGISVTKNKRRFLSLIGADMSYEQIAGEMGISKRTVEGYRDSFFVQFNVSNRASLTHFAIKNGLIEIK